jgi:hypothetical protein
VLTHRAPYSLRRLLLASAATGALACGGETTTPTVTINLSDRTVDFAAPASVTPPAQTVTVSASVGTVNGLSPTVAFGPSASGWMSAAFDDASATSQQPAVLTLTVTRGDLPVGEHTATVTISGSNAANSPTITVSFAVQDVTPTALGVVVQPPATLASGAGLGVTPTVQLLTAEAAPAPVSGVTVGVALEGGAGSLGGTAQAATDAQGVAAFPGLSLQGVAGSYTLLFTSPGLTEARSTAINLTTGGAAELAAASTPADAQIGTAVGDPPAVIVTDEAGNPVAGVSVAFAVAQGQGTIVPTTSVTTDETGIAALDSWTLGPAVGSNSVTATATGLAGSPVTFTVNGTPEPIVIGPPSAGTSSVSRSPGTVAAGSGGSTITVTARDAENHLIPDASVTLEATGSSNTFVSSLTTGSAGGVLGKASTTFTSTKAEPKQITAHISKDGTDITLAPITLTITAAAPNAGLSTVIASPGVVTGLGNSASITVTLLDQFANPVSGRAVTLTPNPASGVTIPPLLSTTDANGQVVGSVSSSTGGDFEIQAKVTTPAVTVDQEAAVTFLISFAGDIEPLFDDGNIQNVLATPGDVNERCSDCHLPLATSPSANAPDLSFARLEDLHDNEKVVTPGNAAISRLIRSLNHELADPNEWMPNMSQQWPPELIDLVARWINQNGAGPLTP